MTKKVDNIVSLYNILKEAKLTKLADADKYAIIKILRKLRPTAEKFDADKKDASERLKPENWDDTIAKAQQWQKEGEDTTLTEEEKKEINATIIKYENSVRECIIEELNTEVEVDMPTINEEAFEKLMASNDWEAKTALFVADEIVTE